MAEQVVRCPYCVLGDQFRPLMPKPGGFFICPTCGHKVKPGDPDFKCLCQKCGELKGAA